METIDVSALPYELRTKLAKLDLELYEGDITEKGYNKRRAHLLEPFLGGKLAPFSDGAAVTTIPAEDDSVEAIKISDDSSKTDNGVVLREGQQKASAHRRYTRDESRYRSDIREEAVKEALARMREEARISQALAPSRRESRKPLPTPQNHNSEMNAQFDSDSAVEEDGSTEISKASNLTKQTNSSNTTSLVASSGNSYKEQRQHITSRQSRRDGPFFSPGANSIRSGLKVVPDDDVYSVPPPDVITQLLQPHQQSNLGNQETLLEHDEEDEEEEEISGFLCDTSTPSHTAANTLDLLPQSLYANTNNMGTGDRTTTSESTDVTSSSLIRSRGDSPPLEETGVVGNRVSEKIQRLMNTLQRPKKRPLSEYFIDDKDALIPVPTPDPNAPQPRGDVMQPLIVEDETLSCLAKDFISAISHYASVAPKSPFITCLDYFSKPSLSLTFSKLYHRSLRIAHMLLNKLGHRGEKSLKPRDRVALVFPNNDPLSFACAFYGCLLASVVPVPIEVPLHDGDTSCQAMGFLLSGASVRVALTNDQCYKALPRNGSTSEVSPLPGWPSAMLWINVEHHQNGVKTPKNWSPVDVRSLEDAMYIEYSYGSDGCVRGVTVSKQSALEHAKALTKAVHYCDSDVLVCVSDAKREVGLWHAILTGLLNGMHVIFVPYVVMKSDPSSWLRLVHKYKATVALVKSRDMHWSMLAARDQTNLSLHSLRMLLVSDGANPWSVATCDAFLTQFRSHGLREDVICTQASSSECLTVALRRPVHVNYAIPSANQSTGVSRSITNIRQSQLRGSSNRGSTRNIATPSSPPNISSNNLPSSTPRMSASRAVLSMHNLSFSVVRVEAENSLTSLSLQDSGTLLPGTTGVVVKPFGDPHLCRTDEVGEICISSRCTGSGYWGLDGYTNSHFKVIPLKENGEIAFPMNTFIRSRLLGFIGPSTSGSGGVIFVCGSLDGLIVSSCRRHNADDLISTVLAVEPMQLVYRGRACVFSVNLLKDARIVVVSELRPGFTSEAIYKWIARVNQALEFIHKVSSYAVALVPHNSLPKTPLGGINVYEIRRRFEQGCLHPSHLLMSPHSSITNLPESRSSGDPHSCGTTASLLMSQVGPSAMLVGSLIQGARLAVAEGPFLTQTRPRHDASQFQYLSEILQWRAQNSPEERLYTLFNHKLQEVSNFTCLQLHRRAEVIGSMLLEKARLGPGANILLLFYPGIELISAVFGCLYAGCVPVQAKAPQRNGATCESLEVSLELVRQICTSCNAAALLTHTPFIKILKAKEIQRNFPYAGWPQVLDIEESYRKKLPTIYRGVYPDQELAYLDYSVSSSGLLYGSRYTHAAVHSMCQAQKLQCELYAGREVVLSMDPYGGLAFILWCLSPVFCGHHCLLIPTTDTLMAPAAWLTLISQRRARDVYCSYLSLELATKQLSKEMVTLKNRGIKLSDLRSLVIVAEERPRMHTINTFCKLFSRLGLNPGVVSTSFGCPVNPAIALRGASHPEATTIYIDKLSLRHDRVRLVERGSPNSLVLLESGTLLPGVRVVIAHPETLGHLAESQLGEICISSGHTSKGFCTVEQSYGTYSRPPQSTPLMEPLESRRRATTSSSSGNSSHSNMQRSQIQTASQYQVNFRPQSPAISDSTSQALQQIAQNRFQVRLQSGDTGTVYARTGYMGFVRRLEYPGAVHEALFVVEEVDESIILRGMRFYPIDLENTVLMSHKTVADCAVFTWSTLVVVVVELDGVERDALDVVSNVTSRVLEEHFLIVGVVVVVDVGTIPHNSAGKKQRLLLRDTFVSDRLDPIYVAYNM